MKKITFISIFWLWVLFASSPMVAIAATYQAPATNQAYLLAVIEQLKTEVLRLQKILIERQLSQTLVRPYDAFLFTRPIETQYFVRDGRLVAGPGIVPRTIDEQLFRLMVDTLGEAAVETYVKEWRVFHADPLELAAFVEQIIDTDTYVVNINRAEMSSDDELNRNSLRELFIHEYAHMLMLHETAQIDLYEKTFWTAADKRFAATDPEEGERERYYKTSRDRFVSPYATHSVDEDMAETFLYAIVKPDRLGTGLLQEKSDFIMVMPKVGGEIRRLRALLN